MSGIYLASRSPRRKEILESLEVEFKIIDYPHKESNPFKNESSYEFIERNTKEKSIAAFAYLQENQQKILPVLTADTIVSLDDRIFGKPETKSYRRMGVILASNLKKAKEALSKIKVVNI